VKVVKRDKNKSENPKIDKKKVEKKKIDKKCCALFVEMSFLAREC
jgi:hypothetical protein